MITAILIVIMNAGKGPEACAPQFLTWEDRFYTPPPPGRELRDCDWCQNWGKSLHTPPPLGSDMPESEFLWVPLSSSDMPLWVPLS